jgi:hypothetical protein
MRTRLVAALLVLLSVHSAFAQAPPEPQKDSTTSSAPAAAPFVPLSGGEKFRFYLRHTYSPGKFGRIVFSSAMLQAWDKPTEWGQGMRGYGHRYGSSLAQHSVKKTVDFAVGALRHEDPRYFRSKLAGFLPRTRYAIAHTYMTRKDDGSWTVALGRVAGVAAGGFLSRTWQPERLHTVASGFIATGESAAIDVGLRWLHEFWPDIRRTILRR